MDEKELSKQMVEAGMLPFDEIIKNPLSPFHVHAGVKDLDTFAQWLDMRHREIMSMRCRMELKKQEGDEMFEWVLSHAAAFSEVVANFNAATNT